jgi:hypothetical protein
MATVKESKLFLKENGCEIWNNYISKITVNSILKKVDYFFDNNLNLGTAVNVAALKQNELVTYGAARQEAQKNNKNFYLKEDDLNKGVNFYRNLTSGISINDPLLNIYEIYQIVTDHNILNLARQYLNSAKIHLGFVKLRRFFCNNLPDFDTNYFHYDDNCDKILKCIVYLNDIINPNDGAFVYVKNSHLNPMPCKEEGGYMGKYARTDQEIKSFYGEDSVIPILGEAGTALFADTLGYHKGLKSKNKDRYVLYINYVLEEEYGGKGLKQKISKDLLKDNNTKELFKFFINKNI